jgi:hypothetical protein
MATKIELTKETVLVDLYQMSATESMEKVRQASTSKDVSSFLIYSYKTSGTDRVNSFNLNHSQKHHFGLENLMVLISGKGWKEGT